MNWENQVREQLLIVTAHKLHMEKSRTNEESKQRFALEGFAGSWGA